MRHAVGADPAAVHALGVERERDAAVGAQRDRAAVAAGRGNVAVDHAVGGAGQRLPGQAHARADLVRGGGAYVELAPAGTRYRAARIGPGAGADDRRIADAAVALVGHAAGGGAGGQLALRIQRQRADRAEVGLARQFQRRVRRLRLGFRGQRVLQLLPALLRAEVRRVDQFDALFGRERLGAVAHHHHVLRMLHHRTRQHDRVAHPVHAGDRAGAAAGAVHDRGIQFVAAVVGEHRAAGGVELRRVLQHPDRRGHRVQRRLAGLELRVAGAQCRLQRPARVGFLRRRQSGALHAGTAVDHQQRRIQGDQHAVAHRVAALGGRTVDPARRQVQQRIDARDHRVHACQLHRLVFGLLLREAAPDHGRASPRRGRVYAGPAVAFHRHRRVLVHAQPDQRPVRQRLALGDEGDQPSEAAAFAEMGIGDDALERVQVQEAGLDGVAVAERIGQRRRRGLAATVHRAVEILALHGQAGAGAAQRLAGAHMRVQRRGHRRAAPVADVARLVAAGQEDAVGALERGQHGRVVRGLAILEHERLHRGDAADLVEELLPDLATLRSAQYHDMAIAGLAHEPADRVEVAVAAAHQQQAGLDFAGGAGRSVAEQVVAQFGRRHRQGQQQARQHRTRHLPHTDTTHRHSTAPGIRRRGGTPRATTSLDEPAAAFPHRGAHRRPRAGLECDHVH